MKERAASRPVAPENISPRKLGGGSHSKKVQSAGARAKPAATGIESTVPQEDGKQHDGGAARVIRDSFTMPVGDYELIGVLKTRCIGLGIAVKKSELLRAGLHALARISDESLAQVVRAVESVKTGRPPGGKKKKKANRAKGKHPRRWRRPTNGCRWAREMRAGADALSTYGIASRRRVQRRVEQSDSDRRNECRRGTAPVQPIERRVARLRQVVQQTRQPCDEQ